MDESRLALADDFLREAVYRSRAKQAATNALARSAAPGLGTCGLGERAAIVLDLDARGRELFAGLWNDALDERELERIRAVTAEWVARQDALDRKRNHFLKAFRGKYGSDRTRYTAKESASYAAGLAEVNAEEDRERQAAARGLVDPS